MTMTPLITRLQRFTRFTSAEIRYLEGPNPTVMEAKGKTTLYHEGQEQAEIFLLISGWACCSKTLRDGRRQVVDFAVPGDMMGLRSLVLRTADHSSSTISACRIWKLRRDHIRNIFEKQPGIAIALLWALACNEAVMVERLVSLGRRTALESMGHLFVELLDRLRLVGLGTNDEFECPLTQDDLADALGITTVHVNRVLRQLRERKIATFRNQKVIIHDVGQLAGFAGYDFSTLSQPPPRLLPALT